MLFHIFFKRVRTDYCNQKYLILMCFVGTCSDLWGLPSDTSSGGTLIFCVVAIHLKLNDIQSHFRKQIPRRERQVMLSIIRSERNEYDYNKRPIFVHLCMTECMEPCYPFKNVSIPVNSDNSSHLILDIRFASFLYRLI